MIEAYSLFQSFTDPVLAQEIAEKLKDADIPVQIDDTSSPIDPVIIGSSLEADIRLSVRQQDFKKANQVLEDYYSQQLDAIEPDYYLFSFTDDELQEILHKPDEWGHFDYKLAQKLLKQRGREVNETQLTTLKAKRIKEKAQPEQVGNSWIWLGYFVSVFFSPLGIFFGIALLTSRKTLPDGNWVYSYDRKGRGHGKNILIISSVLTVVFLLIRLIRVK